MIKKGVQKKYLPEIVYGGIDGIITTFAIVTGSLGASFSSAIILVLGFANLFADGFSMAVSNYLSEKSNNEVNAKKATKKDKKPKKTALATFISFAVLGFIPLIPFLLAFLIPSLANMQITLSIILTAIAFIIVGCFKAKITKQSYTKSAFETLIIGGIAALIAFAIGHVLSSFI